MQITHLLRLLFLCLILLCRQIILLSSTLDPVLLLLAVQRKRWKASYWPPWSSNSNRARNRDLFHTYVPATRAIKINKKQRSVSHERARHKGYQNQQETEICFTRTCPPQGLSKSTREREHVLEITSAHFPGGSNHSLVLWSPSAHSLLISTGLGTKKPLECALKQFPASLCHILRYRCNLQASSYDKGADTVTAQHVYVQMWDRQLQLKINPFPVYTLLLDIIHRWKCC